MAYVSLYRKYRPQTFAEVVGQPHVTTTLANAVTSGRYHHAYLFTGPRGTGKTSTARILAKSLNCEHGPTPDPCGACFQCTAITTGSSVDVIEIDAASHGGVDDVRDLRDRVAFAPAAARKKVYIVDECHMLSTAGWNAFLKTVEEPPGHVVFVFATTEPHKVLPTILSRTQRFDFRRVAADALARHVAELGGREGWTFEPGAIELVVQAGDGSVRDTLSVLEQVVAFTGAEVTRAGVADVLGAVPDELLVELADGIADGDVARLCVLVQRLAESGQDLRAFAREAVEHLRALLLLQVAPAAGLVETTPERLARLQAQADRLGRVELLRAVELLAEAQAQMRRGNTRLPLEIALAKAALPDAAGDPGALAARLDRLERRLAPTTPPTGPPPVTTPAAQAQDGGTPAQGQDAGAPAQGSAPPPKPDTAGTPAPAQLAEPDTAGTSAPAQPPKPDTAGTPAPAQLAEPDTAGTSVPEAPAPAATPAPARPSSSDTAGSAAADSAPAGRPAHTASARDEPPAQASLDLEEVRRAWPAVLERAKRQSPRLGAFLLPGRPAALAAGTLTVAFATGFHAEQCASEQWRSRIEDVLGEVLGTGVRLRCEVDENDEGAAGGTADEQHDLLDEQAAAVAEAEAAAAAGELPSDEEARARAVDLLARGLGAQVIDES